MLCDDLEGWDGGRGGTKSQEGRDICILILLADSHCCMEETNTILQSNYPPFKKMSH